MASLGGAERDGAPRRGPWPRPVRDRIDGPARELALAWPAWGHRKIWALLEVDGHRASPATVERALREHALLQSAGPRSSIRRRAATASGRPTSPSTRPTRPASGSSAAWSTTSPSSRSRARCRRPRPGATPFACSEHARDRASELLGRPLLEDCTDPETGELTPVVVVSDNGACYRAAGFARHIASRPEFAHVRTRHKAPETNGVVERFFQSAKYEHLYREEIDDGQQLAEHVERYLSVYNEIRPHEALDFKLPIDRYLRPPVITLGDRAIGPCS